MFVVTKLSFKSLVSIALQEHVCTATMQRLHPVQLVGGNIRWLIMIRRFADLQTEVDCDDSRVFGQDKNLYRTCNKVLPMLRNVLE